MDSLNVLRSSFLKCPSDQETLEETGLAWGFFAQPFLDEIPINWSSTPIASCYNCSGFANPFTKIINEHEWVCNFCDRPNNLRMINTAKNQPDCIATPILNSMEFPQFNSARINPGKKPPVATYLYLFDISQTAISTGYVHLACDTLLSELDEIGKNPAARIGFITYDKQINLYRISQPHKNELEKLIFSDIDSAYRIKELMVNRPRDFLMNVVKDRPLLVAFLRNLGNELKTNQPEPHSCLRSALSAAYSIIQASGGRVTVFQTCLPNIGEGDLSKQERNISKKYSFKNCDSSYQEMVEVCRSQDVTIDLFLLGADYMDLSTLSILTDESCGNLYRFPHFSASDRPETERFQQTFRRYLIREVGFGSIMKISTTTGISIVRNFSNCPQPRGRRRSGNYQLQTIVIHPDAGFCFQVTVDPSVVLKEVVCFQTAVSYTSKEGQFLTRVHTLRLPVASNLDEVLYSVDQECAMGLQAKLVASGLDDSSQLVKMQHKLTEVRCHYLNALPFQDLNVGPPCQKLFPEYIDAILRSIIFQPVKTLKQLDDCVFVLDQLNSMPLSNLVNLVNSTSRYCSITINSD